jgi:hypothetical protein
MLPKRKSGVFRCLYRMFSFTNAEVAEMGTFLVS